MKIYKGTIKDFSGSWGSGVGYLTIEDSKTKKIEEIPCENGQTVRALENCFGNVITANHTANGTAFKDREIFWSYDEIGLVLGGFTPVEEASAELIEQYYKEDL